MVYLKTYCNGQWFKKVACELSGKTLNAKDIVSEVYELMKVNAKVKNIELINNVDQHLWIYADQNMAANCHSEHSIEFN